MSATNVDIAFAKYVQAGKITLENVRELTTKGPGTVLGEWVNGWERDKLDVVLKNMQSGSIEASADAVKALESFLDRIPDHGERQAGVVKWGIIAVGITAASTILLTGAMLAFPATAGGAFFGTIAGLFGGTELGESVANKIAPVPED